MWGNISSPPQIRFYGMLQIPSYSLSFFRWGQNEKPDHWVLPTKMWIPPSLHPCRQTRPVNDYTEAYAITTKTHILLLLFQGQYETYNGAYYAYMHVTCTISLLQYLAPQII
jgi:hypothetical protein